MRHDSRQSVSDEVEGLAAFKAKARMYRVPLRDALSSVANAFETAPHLIRITQDVLESQKSRITEGLAQFAEICEELPEQERLYAEVEFSNTLLPIVLGFLAAVGDRRNHLGGLSKMPEF